MAQFMKAYRTVLADKNLSLAGKMVMTVLLDEWDHARRMSPGAAVAEGDASMVAISWAAIARLLGMPQVAGSVSCVRRAVAELVRLGWVVTTIPGRGRSPNSYVLSVPEEITLAVARPRRRATAAIARLRGRTANSVARHERATSGALRPRSAPPQARLPDGRQSIRGAPDAATGDDPDLAQGSPGRVSRLGARERWKEALRRSITRTVYAGTPPPDSDETSVNDVVRMFIAAGIAGRCVENWWSEFRRSTPPSRRSLAEFAAFCRADPLFGKMAKMTERDRLAAVIPMSPPPHAPVASPSPSVAPVPRSVRLRLRKPR